MKILGGSFFAGIGIGLVCLLGGTAAKVRWENHDAKKRNQLLTQANDIAKAIDPKLARELGFSPDDKGKPAFERIRAQFISYGKFIKQSNIHSIGMKAGGLYYGPENIDPSDKLASPPGTAYEQPTAENWAIFRTGVPYVKGPYSDEYGTFIGAFAPVTDPASGKVLMVIGIDVLADEWYSELRGSILLPLIFSFIMILLILFFNFLIKIKQGRPVLSQGLFPDIEVIGTVVIGLCISTGIAFLVYESEKNERNAAFYSLAGSYSDKSRDVFKDMANALRTLGETCDESSGMTKRKFQKTTAQLFGITPLNALGWASAGTANSPDGSIRKTFTVKYIEPAEDYGKLCGLDFSSERVVEEILRQSAESGMAETVRIKELGGMQFDSEPLLICCPVQESVSGIRETKGFVIGILKVENFFEKVLSSYINRKKEINSILIDLDISKPAKVIAFYPQKEKETPSLSDKNLLSVKPIFWADHSFALISYPSDSFYKSHPLYVYWMTFLAGACISVLLGALVRLQKNRQSELEREVAQRTGELKDEKENLAITLSSIGDAVIATDVSGRITRMNGVAETLTGCKEKDALNKDLTEVFNIVSADTSKSVGNPVERALKNGKISGLANHTVLIARDGKEYQIADSAAPICNSEGDIKGVVLVFHDVTEEYRMFTALKTAENKFRTLFESSTDALMTLSAETFRFVSGNPAALSIYGVKTEDDFIKLGPWDVSPEKQPDGSLSSEKVRKMIDRALSEGSCSFEWTHVNPALGNFPCMILLTRMEIEDKTLIQATVRDITTQKHTEALLLNSKFELEKLFRSIQCGILIIDNSTHEILDANPAALRMSDCQKEEMAGRVCHKFICPAEKGECPISDKKQSVDNSERILLDKHGNKKQILKTVTNITFHGRDCLLESFVDISEQKAIQEELKKSKEFSMNVLNSLPGNIAVLDINGVIIDVNDSWEKFALDNRDANSYQRCTKGINYLEICRGSMENGDETAAMAFDGIQLVMNGDMEKFTMEYPCDSPDETRWFFMTVRRLGGDLMDGVVVSHENITGLKIAEARIKEQAELMRIMIDGIPDIVNLQRPDHRIIAYNRKGYEYLGKSHEEVAGRKCFELLGRTVPCEICATEKALDRKEIFTVERYLADAGIWQECRSIPVKDKNGTVHTIIEMIRDISSRKRTEMDLEKTNAILKETAEEATRLSVEAQAASVAKSQFIATMSHELRTPMNGIIGMSSLLMDSTVSEEQKEYIETINKCSDTLMTLINDILEIAKIESGKIELKRADFDTRDFLEDIASFMAVQSTAKKLELNCLIDPELPFFLNGDYIRIRQVLVNLIGNAIKFTSKGSVDIKVRPLEKTDGFVTVEFSIKDTGIGIAKEKQDMLFQPFTQIDQSSSRKYEGTGLGLSICKRLVDLMDGQIWVTSDKDAGTEFCFTVKLAEIPGLETKCESTPSDIQKIAPQLDGARIICIDDNRFSFNVLEAFLRRWGFHYEFAENIDIAMEIIRIADASGASFDMAFIDVKMPGINGGNPRELLFSSAPEIKITALCQESTQQEIKHLHEAGFDSCLQKPVRRKHLLNCICSISAKASSNIELAT